MPRHSQVSVDPLVPEVMRLFKNNRKKFNKTEKEWTLKYAKHEENAKNDANDDSSGEWNTGILKQ